MPEFHTSVSGHLFKCPNVKEGQKKEETQGNVFGVLLVLFEAVVLNFKGGRLHGLGVTTEDFNTPTLWPYRSDCRNLLATQRWTLSSRGRKTVRLVISAFVPCQKEGVLTKTAKMTYLRSSLYNKGCAAQTL